MSDLSIKCVSCETIMAPPGTVYVPDDNPYVSHAACSKKCTKTFDEARTQQELMPSWIKCKLILNGHSTEGCIIEKVSLKMKEHDSPVQVLINMPHGTSLDDLSKFAGVPVKISYGTITVEIPSTSLS